MKSIRGKAEEHAPYTKEDSWNWIKTAINAQTSFEAGANYVLGEIEKVLQGDLESHSTFKLKCIKQIIEELKE
jgi:hypothetical protein